MVRLRSGLAPARPTALVLGIGLLGSCVSYEARPLDSRAHMQAWLGQDLKAESLTARLERMELELDYDEHSFDARDGLRLEEGRWVALAYNPELRLARLRLTQATGVAAEAASWPDPQYSLSTLKLREQTPDPWVVTHGLEFSLPLSGRVTALVSLKQANAEVARCTVREAEWKVLHELSLAWVDWSAVQLGVEQTRDQLERLGPMVSSTVQMAQAGELLPTEAGLLALDQALLNSRLQALLGQSAERRQEILALMGLPPQHSVPLVPGLLRREERPAGPQVTDATQLAARNPTLTRLRGQYEVSEQHLRTEIAKQWPDVRLGPGLESDEARTKVGLVGGLTLPLWNANREAIIEAQVGREWARAALESEHQTLLGRLAQIAHRSTSLESQRMHLEERVVPLLDQQIFDAAQLMRRGEGSPIVLVQSLARAHQTQLDWIAMRASLAKAEHERGFLIGPPRTAPEPETKDTIR